MNETKELLKGGARSTGVSLPASLMAALREQARAEQRPISWVVRRALLAYLAGLQPEQGAQNGKAT